MCVCGGGGGRKLLNVLLAPKNGSISVINHRADSKFTIISQMTVHVFFSLSVFDILATLALFLLFPH